MSRRMNNNLADKLPTMNTENDLLKKLVKKMDTLNSTVLQTLP